MLVDKQHVETGAARFTVYCALSFDNDLTGLMCSSAGRRYACKSSAIYHFSHLRTPSRMGN